MTDDETRPKLPNDAAGRSWVVALPDVNAEIAEKRVIGTLLAANDDLQLHVLGTAFVVGASGDQALCMCAAHSIEEAKKFENERRPRSAWNPPPDLVRPAYQYVNPERIKAAFLFGSEVVTCHVDQLHYIDGNDIALITVVAPDGRSLFHDQLALDFAVPTIDTEVAVLGNHINLAPENDRQGQIGLQFQMRHGVVTKVEFGRAYLAGQSSVFYTTIPVPGGMSGSPVLASPKLGAPLTVCGVISSDFSSRKQTVAFLCRDAPQHQCSGPHTASASTAG